MLGPPEGRLVVPVSGPTGAVSVGVVDASRMHGERLDTFDASVHWTRVNGTLDATLVDASAEWDRAIAAAHRALATELVALADEALRIAVGHAKVRVQFGAPIGSFQSPRHALAEASAVLEGARAVLGESWRMAAGCWRKPPRRQPGARIGRSATRRCKSAERSA